jgi:DNA-binding GntR family transcriptional regulator
MPNASPKPLTRNATKSDAMLAESTGDARADAAYQAILAELFGGRLRSGEPISEVELSRRLGMSRTPVHQAVRELVRDGLLTQQPNRRPVFHAFTAQDVQEIYQMRQLLEGEAAAQAALRLDRPTLQSLAADCTDLHKRLKSPTILAQWADVDERFHRAIALASGNRRLAQDIFRYRLVHRGFNTIRFTADLVPQALAEHERVLAALGARDPDTSRSAMLTHLREWQAYYVRSFTSTS